MIHLVKRDTNPCRINGQPESGVDQGTLYLVICGNKSIPTQDEIFWLSEKKNLDILGHYTTLQSALDFALDECVEFGETLAIESNLLDAINMTTGWRWSTRLQRKVK
jgi:hypothetical protein